MGRTLTKSKVEQLGRAVDRAHTAIHKAMESGVSASMMKDVAADLRDAAAGLEALAPSPFAVTVVPTKVKKEPR